MRVAALFAVAMCSGTAHAGSCTDPSNFTPRQTISTKFADFKANQVAVYATATGEETSTVRVLPFYVRSGGIWWRAISDIGGETGSDGLLGEATIDLYAENRQGDVCYGGEFTTAFEHHPENDNLTEVSDEGSFAHGFEGERAGTYMVANPTLNQTWTIESIDDGKLEEKVRVTGVTSTKITLLITHFEEGELVEEETKVFDKCGEVSASVPGEPISTRKTINICS